MCTNDAANMKAQVKYDGTAGEGVEQATFSSCGEMTTKDEVDDSRMVNATLREDECFRTCIVFETSSDEAASMIAPVRPERRKVEAGRRRPIMRKKKIEDKGVPPHVFERLAQLRPRIDKRPKRRKVVARGRTKTVCATKRPSKARKGRMMAMWAMWIRRM